MPIDISGRIEFLKQIQVFNGLDDVGFEAVAKELAEETFLPGNVIIRQGTGDHCWYLIWRGKVSVSYPGKKQEKTTMVAGEYFGEESMLSIPFRRTATITAVEETQLLRLTHEQFHGLLKQIPGLRNNLAAAINTHRLQKKVVFKWLHPGEVILFLTRKHPILLLESLVGPVLLGLAAVIGMFATWYYSLWVPVLGAVWYLSLLLSVFAVSWGVWKGFDWGNDYYVVTDQRVVWLEKVIGLYDSRQETPLSAVQRINVETELTGRMLDYGDLIIQTIVGSTLKLRNVDHPYQAAALIDQYWKRSKEQARKMDMEDIDKALRARLMNGPETPVETKGVMEAPGEKENPYQDHWNIANLFRLRFEHLSTVTYRKHIFVMIKQTLVPGAILLSLLGIFIFEVFSPETSFAKIFSMETEPLMLLWALIFIIALLWWIYEYVDWSNDIFQVTPEQIMDIDKTPLGQVSSDIASLDNILSIENKRIGILELFFNYGNVYITIGGGKEMTFENVYNPSGVQEDIERRRLERITQKEQDTIKAERERVADWFAAYYDNEPRFRQQDPQPGEKKLEDNQPKQ